MTTAYTSLLGLALPVTGELSGTWGSTVNTEITALLDTAIAGTTTLSTDADVTLTTTTGAANTSRQAILLCSGSRTVLRTITAPAQSKIYTIINATTGGFSVKLVGAGPTTGLTIPNGSSAVVAWNGSDFIEIGSSTVGNFTVNGNLTVTGNTTLGDADTDTITQTASYVTGTQLKSAKTATNTLNLAAYDTDGTAYTNLITLTAANAPTLALISTGVGTINNMSIGATTASTGAFTTLSATGNITLGDADTDTITENASYVAGTQLKSAKAATNTLNLAAYDVDGTAYTNLITLTASNTPTLTLTSIGVGTINNMSIGATTASTGAFTTLSATGAVTFNTTSNAQSYTTTGAGTIAISSGTAGTINNMSIGATTRSTGAFTTVGIGTSSPSVNLEVAGSNNSTWSATLTSISGTAMTIAGAVTGTIAIGDIVYGTGVQPYTRITAGSALSWTVSVSQTVASATLVGGATYSNTLIRITDTDTSQAAGQPTGGLQFFTSDASSPTAGVGAYVAALAEDASPDTALVFGTRAAAGGGVDANERMRIDSSGNVGIGTSSPTNTLSVAGNVNVTGNITLGDADTDTITENASYVAGTQLKSAKAATNTLNLAAYDTDGTAYTNLITLTASTTPTLALISTGVGTINNMSIGATTASTGAFTTLSASSTVSGTGFSTYLASPPAIGGTAPAAGAFTTLSATGVTTVQAGTAALPAITTTGDTNTGIWFPAADTIAFTEGGVESMRIDSSGNVLIGTTTVSGRFSVTGTAAGVSAYFTDAVNSSLVIRNALGGVVLGTDAGGILRFATNGNATTDERMRIDSTGNVGIGVTPNASVKLQVKTATNQDFAVVSSSFVTGGVGLSAVNDAFSAYTALDLQGSSIQMGTGGTERMRIDSSGNVLVTNAAGLGYGTGAGGTVTQATSKSTGVTLNKPTGQITMNNAALAASTNVSFQLTNSLIASTDTLICSITTAANYSYQIQTYCGVGIAQILLRNIDSVSRSEAIVINFAIIKGVTA